MNTWQNAVITNKGLALQAKLIAGTTLNITRAVTGSGYVTPGLLQQQTAVTSPQQTMSFRTITYPEIGEACVPVYIENGGLATGYTAMQVGIYATDPDEGEILFFIAQAQSGTGTVVPSETESPGYSAEWNFYFQYGQADDVNVTVDPSNTVSHSEFEAHVNDKDNPHDVTRAQLGLGVTEVTTAGTDLDTYTSRGIFTFASAYAPINAPTGNANGWLFVIPWNEPESVATVKQVWMRHGAVSSNDHESYIRTRIASTGLWSNWAKVITTEDLQNNVTTTEAGYALDARMGKTLHGEIDTLKDSLLRPHYLGDATGRTAITVPSDWEYAFFDVWIDGSKNRIIPFSLSRGTVAIGATYELRNGYYGDSGNYAYVSVNATFSADYTLSLVINTAALTGTDYSATSRLSVNYMSFPRRA